MDLEDLKRNEWIWLLALETAGLALRLRGINSALDGDEVETVRIASGSWSQTIQAALLDRPHPPLDRILLHLWMPVFGSSAASVRSQSLLASVLFLAALWTVSKRFGSRFVAVTATALCTVSPFFVYYGQQARPYSLIAFLAALSVVALLRWTEQPASGSRVAVYMGLCACLMLLQYAGLIFVMTEWLALVLFYRFSMRALAPAPFTIIPVMLWFIAARSASGASMSKFVAWLELPQPRSILESFIIFYGWPPFAHGGTVLLLVTGIGLAGALVGAFTIDSRSRQILLTSAALAMSLPSAFFVVSRITRSSYWAPRQMIASAAIFSIVLAVGLARCTPVLRWSAVIVLFSWVCLSSWSAAPQARRPPWNRVAKTVVERCRDCRVVAFEYWVSGPLSYQLGRPVDIVASVPDTNERMILVCRDFQCPIEQRREGVQQVAQYDWATPPMRLRVFWVAGK